MFRVIWRWVETRRRRWRQRSSFRVNVNAQLERCRMRVSLQISCELWPPRLGAAETPNWRFVWLAAALKSESQSASASSSASAPFLATKLTENLICTFLLHFVKSTWRKRGRTGVDFKPTDNMTYAQYMSFHFCELYFYSQVFFMRSLALLLLRNIKLKLESREIPCKTNT